MGTIFAAKKIRGALNAVRLCREKKDVSGINDDKERRTEKDYQARRTYQVRETDGHFPDIMLCSTYSRSSACPILLLF